MALAFKIMIGTGAIASAAIIAATERGPVPVEPILIAQESFDDRFPFVIVTPKEDRERAATLAPLPPATRANVEPLVKSGHKPKLRSCHRSYYYIKGHRYWRCKRD